MCRIMAMKKNRKKSGFTLVELSIVLVIVGILLFGSLSVYTTAAENARIDSTNKILDAIERALKLHYRVNGGLPCVAVGNLALNDSSFGDEGDCTATAGVIPTRALNLPDSYMFDGWGNRISYIVAAACDEAWISDDCAANLTVQDNTGASERTAGAAYVVLSYGKNGLGAFNRNGNANEAATEPFEVENDDGDTVFRDDFIRDWDDTLTGSGSALAATYFDDIVRWKVPAQISFQD